tara:strand:+ start:898 stop:1788 length:891 start_codon:yes stop_codon:yes gene_type:complete
MVDVYAKSGGVWRTATDVYGKDSTGTWRTASEVWGKDSGGVWRGGSIGGNDPNNPTQSQTFTSSQTWIAPAGITGVRLTLTGATFTSGGTWSTHSNGSLTVGLRFVYSSSTPPSNNSAYQAFNSWASTFNSSFSGSGPRYTSRGKTINYTLDNGDTVNVYEYSSQLFGGGNSNWNSGSVYIKNSFNWYPGGSPYFNPNIMQYTHYAPNKSFTSGVWLCGLQYYVPTASTAGPNASMFGYTATGKTSGTANTVGPVIVSVTPGQSYYFSGGSTYLSTGQHAYPYGLGSTNATAFLEY